ncbi:AMP-binding protein [Corynebacterium anserum]|uniref:AMP-binding protein n=1 Tax=Corynebacterium anserum TaxID=2684406 RepID=A0A7G7YMF0_9CORY|nr:AMP-binding protein [Corynebacterium anserum]QNH95670.1 AMP-binding protein [Corynebacterium anserum]
MPVASPRPDLEIPACGLWGLVFGSLAPEDEDRVAIIDVADGSETTFAELKTYVESAAGGLVHRGVKPGDVVALHCPNSLAFVIAAHAVWRIGAVLTPISLLATEEAIAEQIKDSGTTLLLSVAALGEASANAAKSEGVETIFLDSNNGLQQWFAERRTAPQVSFDPSTHLAALPYSSGTTGLPKGVKLTHENLVMNVLQAQDAQLVTRDDVIFGVLPFFHIYGLTALANLSLTTRATLITQPRFEVESFLTAHQKFGVTFTFIAPPIAVLLAKHPVVEKFNLSTLRAVLSGAAALDEELALAVEKRLGVHVEQGYGMTETSPVTHTNSDPQMNRGSIGKPVANTEHKLVDPESGNEIGLPEPGERSAVGELWVRGPQIMKGYLNRPEETAATLPGDGWLRTGDLAEQDSEGNVFIVDRLKELIKYKGYQVPPAELEALLLNNDHVADAAVIGVVRKGEEIPKAFIVLQQGCENTDAEKQSIMDFVAERVAPYKKIREVEFIDQIPKSSTGKILRRELKAREK